MVAQGCAPPHHAAHRMFACYRSWDNRLSIAHIVTYRWNLNKNERSSDVSEHHKEWVVSLASKAASLMKKMVEDIETSFTLPSPRRHAHFQELVGSNSAAASVCVCPPPPQNTHCAQRRVARSRRS